jgi:hypothetical protein
MYIQRERQLFRAKLLELDKTGIGNLKLFEYLLVSCHDPEFQNFRVFISVITVYGEGLIM